MFLRLTCFKTWHFVYMIKKIRLFLYEQLYRATMIRANSAYHKWRNIMMGRVGGRTYVETVSVAACMSLEVEFRHACLFPGGRRAHWCPGKICGQRRYQFLLGYSQGPRRAMASPRGCRWVVPVYCSLLGALGSEGWEFGTGDFKDTFWRGVFEVM